jgi:hypothetical protein
VASAPEATAREMEIPKLRILPKQELHNGQVDGADEMTGTVVRIRRTVANSEDRPAFVDHLPDG